MINEFENSRYSDLKEWEYTYTGDVNQNDERYPIVVLRTGYKLIKLDASEALIGWSYEFMNTSKTTRYSPKVTFELQDIDGFKIAQGEGDSIVLSSSYGEIKDTILIKTSDLERLQLSSWTIRIPGDWKSKEKDSKGKRYERLTEIDKDEWPYWIDKFSKTEEYAFYTLLDDKYKAIAKVYPAIKKEKESSEVDIEKISNVDISKEE